MLYSNVDQFLNKRDDFCCMIAEDKPDIILLTEIIPKAQALPISPCLLSLDGYVLHTNFDPGRPNLGSSGYRGISVYLSEKLQATEMTYASTFHEQLWVSVKLINSDKLIVGCIYRSPTGDNHASVTELGNLLREVSCNNPSHLLVVGDFNVPQVDWDNHFSAAPEGHYSHLFLQAIGDC